MHVGGGYFPCETHLRHRVFSDQEIEDNPLAAAEVATILADAPPEAPGGPLSPSVLSDTDPFGALPVKLCSSIAMYLSTADALNARLASRAFWHLFDSVQFWASRFKGTSDRSWLFEARHPSVLGDCRWLYRRTASHRIGRGLQNRKRIWNLIQGLGRLLDLRLEDALPSCHRCGSLPLKKTGIGCR